MSNTVISQNQQPKFQNVMDSIPQQYIISLQGQKFIRFGGLQYLLDSMGGTYRIQTECVSRRGSAQTLEITYEAKIFHIPSEEYLSKKGIAVDNPCIANMLLPTVAHGVVNVDNTNGNMFKKFPEVLAETRAIARAMRFITGCPFTAVEELDKRDFKNVKADEWGDGEVSVETLEEMMIKENSAPVQQARVDPAKVKRDEMIMHIKNAKKKNKGVEEVVNGFLDRNNAMIIENLSTEKLSELNASVDKLIGA